MLRARSQLIHRPRGSSHPADVLRAIAGAQSQEPRAGRLQVRARDRRLTAAGIEAARVEERSILRTWLMRMTVHLIPTEDYGWMAPLFANRVTAFSQRRLDVLGITVAQRDRALTAIRKRLRADGALTRMEAMAIAQASGFDVNPQTRTHLIVLLVVMGDACIGPDRGRDSLLVSSPDWIGEPATRGREESLRELALRYFAAFAPATERDFSFWSGLPLRECRVGLEAAAGALEHVDGAGAKAGGAERGGTPLLAPRGFTARAPRSPVVRLLPAYDTYLMGYASRSHATDPAGEKRVLPGGGVLRPTICVDGRFAGLWANRRSGRRLTIELEPFEPLPDEVADALSEEAADIGRFEGVEAALA